LTNRIKNDIFLYNVEKNETIKLISGDKYFQIGSVSYKEDSIFFTLYYDLSFTLDTKNIIYEKEYLIKEGKCILLAENKIRWANDSIPRNLEGLKFYLESVKPNGEKTVSVINGYDTLLMRQSRDNKYCRSDMNGNLFIVRDNKKEVLLSSKDKGGGEICGYHSPDLSNDGKYIVCYYACFKYNGKKCTESSNLLEFNVVNGEMKDLGISGSEPRYSQDGNFILYISKGNYKDGGYFFCILDKKNMNVLVEFSAIEAYWIKGK